MTTALRYLEGFCVLLALAVVAFIFGIVARPNGSRQAVHGRQFKE